MKKIKWKENKYNEKISWQKNINNEQINTAYNIKLEDIWTINSKNIHNTQKTEKIFR